MPEYAFPEELLHSPTKDRIRYFEGKTAGHPRLMEVDKQLQNAIRNSGDQLLIFVYGPTGVGKTTLRRRVEKVLIEESLPTLESNPGLIPIISLDIPQTGSIQFSWKDYYERVLTLLNEPIMQYGRRPSANDLRRVLENAFRERRPRACILDEAQHLWSSNSGQSVQKQLDTIKSISNETGIPHVFIGTYEMLPFRNLSGQLTRRSHDIHFRRYDARNHEDVKTFCHIIEYFQSAMPFNRKPDLMAHWQFLYEQTLGCVGILKPLLLKAYKFALESGQNTVTVQNLKACSFSNSQRRSMMEAIAIGESGLADDPSEDEALRLALGLHSPAVQPERQTTSRSKKPGVRKPARDEIGRATLQSGAYS